MVMPIRDVVTAAHAPLQYNAWSSPATLANPVATIAMATIVMPPATNVTTVAAPMITGAVTGTLAMVAALLMMKTMKTANPPS